MANLATFSLKQKAVLWHFVSEDDFGEIVVASPVEINCRWEDAKTDPQNKEANTISYDATGAVDRDIPIHSILRLGALADLPDEPDNLYQVLKFEKIPGLKRNMMRREMGLTRFGDTLPTIGGSGT